MNNTLSKGTLAYIDTAFSGLVPCKVLRIEDTADLTQAIRFELTKGGISSRYQATVQVTKDAAGYRKGETIETFAHDVVPRSCVRRRCHSTWIKAYTVEVG